MKNLYLVLAIVGAVAPYVFFVEHFTTEGLALGGFLAAVFANPAASGAMVDLVVSSLVFWVWVAARGDARRLAVLVPVNLLIGLSCALPLYLYLREREREAGGVRAATA